MKFSRIKFRERNVCMQRLKLRRGGIRTAVCLCVCAYLQDACMCLYVFTGFDSTACVPVHSALVVQRIEK